MEIQSVFKRYELKYLLSERQLDAVLEAMKGHTEPDRFPHSLIRNIYYDTGNYRLARTSIEGPHYKEKLRVRSYSAAEASSPVFVELKKKYDSVVYKRRIAVPNAEAQRWLSGAGAGTRADQGQLEKLSGSDRQIAGEIDYFVDHYRGLKPAAAISYERDSYAGTDCDIRITFDRNILARTEDIDLSGIGGAALIPEGTVLMELKCPGCMPLWMSEVLSQERIYKSSFSKYGTAYRTMIFPALSKKASD